MAKDIKPKAVYSSVKMWREKNMVRSKTKIEEGINIDASVSIHPSYGVGHNSYFTDPKPNISFVSSGCTLLDCALGGGWAVGRISNIVGDKSTAKTALAVEALANFLQQYPDGKAAYRDAEAAFDEGYAEAMGLHVEKVDFGDPDKPLITVEDWANDLESFANGCTDHGIYILDSLDALTTETELERSYGDQGFGQSKAKLMSEVFRKIKHVLKQKNILLIIVSQVRANIGVSFGEKYTRSGGKALDFYASQIVWLARKGTIEVTIKKEKRVTGLELIANVKKNKIGTPHRKVEFEFHFGYGIEDMGASLDWLNKVGRMDEVKIALGDLSVMSNEKYREVTPMVAEATKRVWVEIETTFLPTRKKYE